MAATTGGASHPLDGRGDQRSPHHQHHTPAGAASSIEQRAVENSSARMGVCVLFYHTPPQVASIEDFCSLCVNQLTEIISHDELNVKEETTVWEAVVRWVQHSREDRLQHLPSILSHIRFNLLTSDDTTAILEHTLVREDPRCSEVIRDVVQKGNTDLRPRHGMFTEMMLMFDFMRCKEIFFMNPREGKYINCSYKPEDLSCITDIVVTSDNNIYILQLKMEAGNQLSLFKYNHAKNAWEQAGVSSVTGEPVYDQAFGATSLIALGGILYFIRVDPVDYEEHRRLQMRKYDPHSNQWQECSQLGLGETIDDIGTFSCGPNLYYLSHTTLHCYDPSMDMWYKRTPPMTITYLEIHAAVAIGTEIFCTDFEFTQTMVYDTESDCWQIRQGWPNPGNFSVEGCQNLFVLENQLHILLTCLRDSHTGNIYQEDYIYLVYVYDRSADAWRELKANLPYKKYHTYYSCSPVARIYLPYLKGT
ncbi:kelch repeat and BTB domain-containing protein 2-like [Branchiostoma floridae]|uniref:Kelch repeat and BTB domain-containing protein 2-like n=1 Tax=Branchiostoma floridae TaxID=7739 RepID=A0A9J7HPT1_BRAFL|nr:kelch repeat and BTB domain-containing protein 2-like [Branchiostoma floridae]